MPPGSGLKVPASISSAKNARTSWRSAWHSGGRRIASKVSSVAMPVSSALGQHRPQAIGAVGGDQSPELDRPGALVAEIVAPGPQAAREAVQDMLLREPDGTQYLVGDARTLGGRLADPYFRGGDFQEDASVPLPLAGRG